MIGLPGKLPLLRLLGAKEDFGRKVTTSSTSNPPSSDEEGTGEDESEEVVEGVNGQITSFLSFRSSNCRGQKYISAI